MLALARSVGLGSFEELFMQREEKTIDYLRNLKFSDTFIEAFFRPFFAGACLDRSLTASSRVLRYIFRVFAQGDAALPAHGMEEIPRQLETSLPAGCIRFNSKAAAVEKGKVTLTSGESFLAKHIVLATSQPAAEILTGKTETPSIRESCIYFSADWQPPFDKPFLVLNGENSGPINNIAFPSLVSPYYSPHGKTLIAAVVLGKENCTDPDIIGRVRKQCSQWFGSSVNGWQHLHTYQIRHALPDQLPPTANPYELPVPLDKTLRIAGESGSLPGIQWALLSGRKTAESIIEDLQL
jgi:phytoene dehydrogenase-like protein